MSASVHAARRPELLAPAGDWECARAAVENGADAIYFGLERFNARMRAKNFTQADLPALMEFLHRRGVRGYVTFNTLVFANELAAAEDYLRSIIAAGVDAAIVQDIGMCRMIRALSPDFPIHGSTQMTITSAAGVAFARELGAQLVVLARENSIAEIEKIQRAQGAGELEIGGSKLVPPSNSPSSPTSNSQLQTPLPLEVFVHGALCVAYSGQCLTSESLGGRSANRGECAQACRLPYDLISDGQQVALGDRRYLLSPQDLAGLEVLPDLIRAGVASLKIEGRLKSPEYVASVTRVYRQALDGIVQSRESRAESKSGDASGLALDSGLSAIDPAARSVAEYQLQMAFSRGQYTGWFRGNNNQELAHGRFGTKRGVYLGIVARVDHESISIPLEAPLKPGDGVVFDAGNPEQGEEGGRVYQVDPRQGETVVRFGHGDIDWRRIRAGQRLWKTNDPALDRELRATFEGDKIRFQRPIDAEVHGAANGPLTLLLNDRDGHVVKVDSAVPLAVAQNQPLTEEKLRDQLGRLGGTPFQLGTLRNHLESDVILPVSALNQVRRDAVAELERLRAAPKQWTLSDESLELRAKRPEMAESSRDARKTSLDSPSELIAVIRLLDQLDAAWHAGARTLYCEFENPKLYRDAVARFRELQAREKAESSESRAESNTAPDSPVSDSQLSSLNSKLHASPHASRLAASIWVAAPRIFKPGEEWILQQVRSSAADGYLVRNYDHLAYFAADRKRGDFSLNVANPWTAEYFIRRYGLERVTASYDLNVEQLEALLATSNPAWLDVTIHQHMPMFHMEHCVFCAFLSTGKDYRDCGRPCEKHRVALRDRVGAELPLRADAGCRNTVFNNRAQTGAEYVGRMQALGARHFRVEFVNESADEVTRTLDRYGRLLRGELSGADLWRELKLVNQLGVTRGQMQAAPQIIAKKR